MTRWSGRPQVSAAYLNPALVSVILAAAAKAYRSEKNKAMVWPLAFVVAPMVLHRSTRLALPRSSSTHLATWLSRNAVLHAGFASRTKEAIPIVREGLRFGLRHNVLTLEAGALNGSIGDSHNPELRPLLTSARLVGRWLAKIDQPSTVFAILGLEP